MNSIILAYICKEVGSQEFDVLAEALSTEENKPDTKMKEGNPQEQNSRRGFDYYVSTTATSSTVSVQQEIIHNSVDSSSVIPSSASSLSCSEASSAPSPTLAIELNRQHSTPDLFIRRMRKRFASKLTRLQTVAASNNHPFIKEESLEDLIIPSHANLAIQLMENDFSNDRPPTSPSIGSSNHYNNSNAENQDPPTDAELKHVNCVEITKEGTVKESHRDSSYTQIVVDVSAKISDTDTDAMDEEIMYQPIIEDDLVEEFFDWPSTESQKDKSNGNIWSKKSLKRTIQISGVVFYSRTNFKKSLRKKKVTKNNKNNGTRRILIG